MACFVKIADLPLPAQVIKQLQTTEPFSSLFPPQTEAIHAGLFEGENLLIAIPTASGKTFIAELCALQHIIVSKSRVLYLAPLRALAMEKYRDFKRFESLGIKVGITTGDFDAKDLGLNKFDFVVSTNEKVDALLRHRLDIVDEVSLLIVDECHLIDDPSRGPTLETLLVKIQMLNPQTQILALSATVKNAEELAQWLKATLIQSDWRPVPLTEAYCTMDGRLHYRNGKTRNLNMNNHTNLHSVLVAETLSQQGQVLIFAPSRRSAQKMASLIAPVASQFLSSAEENQLKEAASNLIIDEQTDKLSEGLLNLFQNGVAFHHAGLSSIQRSTIEQMFKDRILKVITATPTLAAGVNAPARRVIITSFWRYSMVSGRQIPIKILEYEQMRGRSGRPKYDTEGEAIIICQNERDEDIVQSTYFSGKGPEPIDSKLAARPALRIHLLGVIATGLVKNYVELQLFLEKTFFGFHYGNTSKLEVILRDVISDLINFGFITQKNAGEDLSITRLGKRVSQLYIDPVTANTLIHGFGMALSQTSWPDIIFLHLFSDVPDVRRMSLRKKDWSSLENEFQLLQDQIITAPVASWSLDYQRTLEAFRTAKIIELWIKEKPIPELLNETDLQLGDLHRLVDAIKWISYSATQLGEEIVRLFNQGESIESFYPSFSQSKVKRLQELHNHIKSIEIRVEFGIKQDLLPLINLKGIGRVKARTLMQYNITTLEDLRAKPIQDLLKIPGLGPVLCKELKAQVGELIEDDEINRYIASRQLNKPKKSNPARKKLIDFLDS